MKPRSVEMYLVGITSNGGEFEYRIRNSSEAHERVARESEISRPYFN
jgi:hypothetical protein